MKIIDLYRIETKSFKSNLKKTEIENKLINEFNLNQNRDFRSIFKKELNEYRGTLNRKSFIIKQNNALTSINDGNYFFFTRINGEILDNGTERIIKINAELSEGTIGMVIASAPIYILILIFSNLWVGITSLLFLIFLYLYGVRNVKSDFKVFETHLKQKITVYNNVYN